MLKISQIFHRAEAVIGGFEESHEHLSVLAVNENAYMLALLAFVSLFPPFSKIHAVKLIS